MDSTEQDPEGDQTGEMFGIKTEIVDEPSSGAQELTGGSVMEQQEQQNYSGSASATPKEEDSMESGDGGGTPGQESTPVEAAEAESQQAPSHCPPESTLWMGALKAEWTPDFIREAFRLMGVEIVGVKLTTDRGDPSKPGTYCFVEFADSDTARLAMVAAAGHTIRNDPEKGKFHLSFANSPQHTTEYNLFISNLDRSVDDVDLFRIFGAKYASCRGAKIYRNLDGTSREFGFVRFTSETDQQRALVEMNKHKVKGREMMIKLALPKTRVGRHYLRGPNPHMSRGGAFGGGGYRGSTGTGLLPTPQFLPAGQTIQIGSTLATVLGFGPGGILPVPPMIQVGNHGAAGFGTPAMQQSYVAPVMVQAPLVGQNYAAQYGGAIIQQPGGIYSTPAAMNTTTVYGTDMSSGGGGGYRSSSGRGGYHQDSSYSSSRYASTSRRRPYNHSTSPKPKPVLFEGIEPLTAEEHNALMMESAGDLLCTMEGSRWNRIALPYDAKTKDVTNLLFNAF